MATSTIHGDGIAPRVQPLRVDTVLRALQGVKDWKRLGESILGCTNPKLIAIQKQRASNEDRLRAVVEHWLQNGGCPSWRVIMWALDWAEESQLADSIRDYAEPPRDPTLTVENVIAIFEEVNDWQRLRTQLDVPEHLVHKQQHLTEREQKHVIGEWYVRTSPLASWEDLMMRLYNIEEDEAVEEAKQHLTNDKFLTTENIMDVVKDVDEFWDSLGRQLGVRQSERDSIRNLHQNDHQKMEAMLDHYVTRYPVPSWKRFAATIQGMGFANLADVVTVRYITGDPTFTPDNIMEVMKDQEERWEILGDLLGVEKSVRERIGYLYQSDPHQKMRAILDHYVRHNRRASWKRLATALKRMGLDNLADVVTADHVREPSITAHPKSQRSLTGDTVTFHVETTGKPPLHFSWLHGKTAVKGAQSSVLILTDVRKSDEGEYRCLLENQFGKILSKPAELQVDDPGIAAHPKSQKCFPGETVTFRIEARGETQLTFRWLHGECVMKGADGPVLTLTEVSDYECGIYMCEVENQSGKVSSNVVELEVGDPLIISHPESQISLPGEVVTFSVEAKGTSPLHFRWLHDGNVVKGETNVLTLAGVRKTDSGRYLCQVENQSGMKESNPAELCVANIEYSDLNILRDNKLGSGAFGTVWKGVWIPGGKVVAVKEGDQLNPREVEILQSLSHPNIIVFHGCVFDPHGTLLLVTEFAENGSIFDYVHKWNKKPSLQQGLHWAEQIAKGMEYLHQQKYIHRDLKSSNVLLSSDLTAKICDLGSARNLQHATKQTTVVGTYAWMAPEMLLRSEVSTACDVYSYGILLWEIITHEMPFPDVAPLVAALDAADNEKRLRPPLPDCEAYLKCLIEQCWQHAPKDRPTFSEILTVLKTKCFYEELSGAD